LPPGQSIEKIRHDLVVFAATQVDEIENAKRASDVQWLDAM